MALTALRPCSLLLLVFFLRFTRQFPDVLRRKNHAGGVAEEGLPMILPLYSPSPNTNHASDNFHSRKLQKSSGHPTASARMRLHDDLLSNGYYTTRLFIGTPPQKFALIVDTGSTITYIPCSSCRKCGFHQDPRFKPELSSSYRPVKCNSNCNCDKEGKQCMYKRSYAEMSSSSGVLGEDIISFGDESKLVPQRAVFGCENVETGDLYSQRADGIMGLGRGRLSVVDQLVRKGVISDSFSLCYGGMGVGGGAMVLGAFSPPPEMVFSHSNPYRSPYYNIELKDIHVAGKPLRLDPNIFDRKHGTVLDSGTTYAYLPELAFVAFKDAIMKKVYRLKQIPGPDPNYKDICFSGAGRHVSELSKSFPKVDMIFGNGQKWSLSPEDYVFQHTKVHGAYCLGIFQNGKDPTTLLGGIIVRDTLVTYDRGNKRIGFWKTNCSGLWNQQEVPVSPATVPVNITNKIPPVPAPALVPAPAPAPAPALALAPASALIGLPQNALPDEFRVGLIRFDMSLIVGNSSMKPNFTEFAKFIAQELEVNTSQVNVLTIASKGIDYLVRWAIYPAEPAYYISNTTAVRIILRLIEHRVRLPESFGSYQLVEWNVEPPKNKSWWEQHFWAVVVGIGVALVLGLSAMGISFVRRRQLQRLDAYRPVDAVVPEQELQPLQT